MFTILFLSIFGGYRTVIWLVYNLCLCNFHQCAHCQGKARHGNLVHVALPLVHPGRGFLQCLQYGWFLFFDAWSPRFLLTYLPWLNNQPNPLFRISSIYILEYHPNIYFIPTILFWTLPVKLLMPDHHLVHLGQGFYSVHNMNDFGFWYILVQIYCSIPHC